MFEDAIRSWQFWVFIGAALLGYGELKWTVAQHKKKLNGPFDVARECIANIKTRLGVIDERLTTRQREVEQIRDLIIQERNERRESAQRIHEKIDRFIEMK